MQTVKTLSTLFFISLLFTIHAIGQPTVKTYEKEWKKVTAFVEKGLPQSALLEVKNILALARKEKQDAQIIKALVTMTMLQSETRENNEALSFREIEAELAISKEPATSILNSLLAEKYWQYFNNHRYQLYNRTATAPEFRKDDIATWDAEDFHKKIGDLFLLSIKNEKLLQQTALAPFDALIIKGNVRHLRPTLFDLLAHRAVAYFASDERSINRPAYAFEIEQASAFDPAADFVTRKFITRDSLSLQHKALLTYQRLIAFHLKDSRPDALIDVDLQRIQFVKSKSVHPDKDRLYFNAINHVANQYNNHPAAAQAWYLLASYYEQKASTYQPYGDTTHRYARVKAKEILDRILVQKDSSEGKTNAINLLRAIQDKTLQFKVEKVNLPSQPFRVLVDYRNFNTLHLRLLRADEQVKKLLESPYEEKSWTSLIGIKAERSWQQNLPITSDMQQHHVEIKVDGLPVGEYVLLAGTDKDFNNKSTRLGARMFYVSNISFVNHGDDYFVLDRNNGQPLAQAAVQVWEQKYDYKLSKMVREKLKLYRTDPKGFFRLERPRTEKQNYRQNGILLEISNKNDRLFMNDWIFDQYYYRDEPRTDSKSTNAVYLFADRSLYRPGQVLFFKGIVLTRNSMQKTGNVLSNYTTTIYLRDANYQDIDSIRLTTNEFGSFNGRFQLPSAGLNGQFSIYTKKDNGQASFNVEEYKRPKFYVDYEPIKGTYRVNDTIRITGFAKAYAGNDIDGATVKYHVIREPRFLYPWFFWQRIFPPTEPMQIAHGEVKTSADGKFVITFTAIPDLSIDKKLDPVFDYKVYADVTDINGETRSGEQMVSVGYKALILRTVIPERMSTDSLVKWSIRTENMNGEFQPADLRVTVTSLQPEKRLVRNRYWERPDQFLMSKQEYISYFPFDEYDNETDPRSWQKAEKVFEKTDSARVSGEWNMTSGKFEPGHYMVEIITKDKDGQEVKDVRFIELFEENNNQLPSPQYLWSQGAHPIEPGEKTSITIGTSADQVFVIRQVEKPGITGRDEPGLSTYEIIRLNNEKRKFDFTATEDDRGGYGVSWIFVKHNRFYQSNHTIVVPWTNKDLKIEYATFRDKTLPGSTEKWKLKITGLKKEKVAAELLASMYDASLDQFHPHGWQKPAIWPSYYNTRQWNGSTNFVSFESHSRYIALDQTFLVKTYDRLWTDNSYDDAVFFPGMERRDKFSYNVTMQRAPSVANDMMAEGALAGKVSGLTVTTDTNTREENQKKKEENQGPEVQIRKNFNETAFFFPALLTDSAGSIEFSFTIPEALTRWKFMALAHTKDAAFGSSTQEIITQKQLMVQPNAPRFVREGDKLEFSTKIVNLTEKEMTGQVELQLFDATTNQPVDGWFKNMMPNQYFTVAAGQSEPVRFPVEIPYLFNKALTWRLIARSGDYSDGEENTLPVLTNRMLVTETIPLNVRGTGTRNFTFDKLLNAGKSESLQHHALTIEYTSNPAWYAIQALPYLMEYPYDCSEQTWNRYYANSLASFISNSSPRIRQVFDKWKITDTAALLSNLQKNQELKSVLLEETPWVLQARTESEQKRNIGLLFDLMKMKQELNSSFEKLRQMQSENGGFVWFKGGPDDRYMTQYIVTGIGHLKKLGAFADDGQESKMNQLLATALPYLDRKIREEYDEMVRRKADLKTYMPGYTVVQYLYMRSFFPSTKIPAASMTAVTYFRERLKATWTKHNKYMQGMIALALHRANDKRTPVDILKSLRETSINNEELGMYWKDAARSWWWYEAPIERQALLIEAFQEIAKDTKTVDDLRTWLLKNKQTTNWNTTKATAEACYALLLQGTQWLNTEPVVEIKLGTTTLRSTDQSQEAGTGYFKKTVEGSQVKPAMGQVSVTVQPAGANQVGTTWGGIYWQYFEDLDKITTAATPLAIVKKLFVEKNTDRGPVLTPIHEGDAIKVGDKIKVRIELRVDRDMEYVHMKDMRASALEPVNVISSYKWQGGLGYYETTRDASTNFFFNYLRKGTYVFEYALFASHTGNFSNGITSIQCMYAPEFSSHSEGIRINIE